MSEAIKAQAERPSSDPTKSCHSCASANLALVLLIFFFGFMLFHDIGERSVAYWDELKTAERSREFLASGDLTTVRINFQPDFKKPPLHYLQTALALAVFDDPEFAVRFWSVVYGMACLVAMLWLMRTLQGSDNWSEFLALFLLSTCLPFYITAGKALLDTGMTFFLLLTIIGLEKARKDPRWWWLAFAGIVLGFLQKFPVGLVYFLFVLILNPWIDGRPLNLKSSSFRNSGIAALAVIILWPLSQVAVHSLFFFKVFFKREMYDRITNPNYHTYSEDWSYYLQVISTDWGWLGIACALALAIALIFPQTRKDPTLRTLAIFTICFIAVLSIFRVRFLRYLIPVLPLLALILPMVIKKLAGERRWISIVAILAAIVLFNYQGKELVIRSPEFRDQYCAIDVFKSHHSAELTPALLIPQNKHDFPPYFLLFYGNLKQPMFWLTHEENKRYRPLKEVVEKESRLLLIFHKSQEAEVRANFTDIERVEPPTSSLAGDFWVAKVTPSPECTLRTRTW